MVIQCWVAITKVDQKYKLQIIIGEENVFVPICTIAFLPNLLFLLHNTVHLPVNYKEFLPADALRPFIKCYYIFEAGEGTMFEDKAYATGCVEAMFNIGEGSWQINNGHGFTTTPRIELWGQIIEPLTFKSIGKNSMFGVRFLPHAASIFLKEDVSLFNNNITDLADVAGKVVKDIHLKLLEAKSLEQRINCLNSFFIQQLVSAENKIHKAGMVNGVMKELNQQDFFDNIDNVASRFGISSRYLQKIFLMHTGLKPKLYAKIHRFQNSLQYISAKKLSLTEIAYECGYFDQSHFIREFRSFTGKTPSSFDTANTSAILASPNK